MRQIDENWDEKRISKAEPKMAEHKIEAENSQRYKSELFD